MAKVTRSSVLNLHSGIDSDQISVGIVSFSAGDSAVVVRPHDPGQSSYYCLPDVHRDELFWRPVPGEDSGSIQLAAEWLAAGASDDLDFPVTVSGVDDITDTVMAFSEEEVQ
jgi:hypothetical protein